MDQLMIHSLLVESLSRKLSHMLVLNNNQKVSQIQKLSSWKYNLNLNQKNKTQKLELKTLMISKVLLMLNGKLFMKNSKKLKTLEPILYCQNSQLEIWPLNGLPIEEFSVLVEFQKMIWKELPRLLELNFKLLSIMSHLMFWVLVEASNKNKLVPKDTTYSKNALILNQPQSF